jgi:hypothetical protein
MKHAPLPLRLHERRFNTCREDDAGLAQRRRLFDLTARTRTDLGEGKSEVTYSYQVGNSPNPGRSAVNGYIDLYTLGLAEPILTIIELIQGDDVETRVVYGPDLRAIEIRGYTPPAPSAELKAAQEEQDKYVRKRPAEQLKHPD